MRHVLERDQGVKWDPAPAAQEEGEGWIALTRAAWGRRVCLTGPAATKEKFRPREGKLT